MAMHSDLGRDKVICAWDENNNISQVGQRMYPNDVLSQYVSRLGKDHSNAY